MLGYDWTPSSVLELSFMALVLFKLYSFITVGRCKSEQRMDGKVVIITGANSGIGRETARNLLHRGAKVIMACRNMEKARRAARELLEEKPSGEIVVKYIDCCNLKSVRIFAEHILESEKKLDVLINNAGVCGDHSEMTDDGFESLFQTNYLAPVLLTELLLPLLKKSAPSRVINVGSSIYNFGNCNPDTLGDDFRRSPRIPVLRYGDSKLLLIMFSKALNGELEGSGVTVNVGDPGMARTMIASKRFSIVNIVASLNVLICGRSVADASQTVIQLSVGSIAHSDNGKYWMNCKPTAPWKGNDSVVNHRVLEITRRTLNMEPRKCADSSLFPPKRDENQFWRLSERGLTIRNAKSQTL